jgi:hypothetical protein
VALISRSSRYKVGHLVDGDAEVLCAARTLQQRVAGEHPRPGAPALNSAPTPYIARPIVKHRLRPYLSVISPPGIMSAPITSRKMVIAICTPCREMSRSWLLSLIVTFMLEPAKLQMNWAKASGMSAVRSAVD